MRYPAIISGTEGNYQVAFPDLPGCVAEGDTIDDAIIAGEAAMQRWIAGMQELAQDIPVPTRPEKVDIPAGATLTTILMVHAEPEKGNVRVNISIDPGVLKSMDSEATRRGMSRKRYLEWLMRYVAQTGA